MLKTDDSCERCKYGGGNYCAIGCSVCPLKVGVGCQCAYIPKNTECRFFEEKEVIIKHGNQKR